MKKLVGAGNYVTGVSQDANGGLVFTMSNGSPITIGNVVNGEKVEAGDKVTFNEETGEILLNGKATGKFVNKAGKPGEVKVPFVKDGILYVYNEAGEAEATGIRVNPVTAVQDPATGAWTLTITAADGTTQTIKVPSANSLVTALKIVTPASIGAQLVNYVKPATDKELINVNKESFGKNVVVAPFTEDGKKGFYVDVMVTPSTVDVKDLTFNVQNSLGKSVWSKGVVVENTEALGRSTGIHRVYFEYAKDATVDKIEGETKIVENGKQLYVACGNALSGDINVDVIGSAIVAPTSMSISDAHVKLGETYDLFGFAYEEDPSGKAAAYKPSINMLSDVTGVTDIKLSIGADYVSEYGITIDGTKFSISKSAAYGITIPFDIVYTDATSLKDADKPVHTWASKLNITVQTPPTASAVTLQSSYQLHQNTDIMKMVAYFPIENLVNAITGANKITWNSKTVADLTMATAIVDPSTNAITYDQHLVFTSSKLYGVAPLVLNTVATNNNAFTQEDEIGGLMFFDKDKKQLASDAKLTSVKYVGFVVAPDRKNVAVDTYTSDVKIEVAGITNPIMGKLELTFTNPDFTIARVSEFFKENVVTAYGVGNGAGTVFDINTVYTIGKNLCKNFAISKIEKTEGMANVNNWTGKNTKDLTIAAKAFYSEMAKVTVSATVFPNSDNNKFEDTFFVKAQSPIKDGTIDLNKNILELTQGASTGITFTQADFTTKDVFGDKYNLFNVMTKAADATAGTPAVYGGQSTNIKGISVVTTDPEVEKVLTINMVDEKGEVATYDKAVGIKFAAKTGARLENGKTVKVTVKVVDAWGQTTEKEVTLTVKTI